MALKDGRFAFVPRTSTGLTSIRSSCRSDSSYPPNGLHQGGMVQLKNGDWWFIIMQDRGAIGRVPYLVPVTWKDGWPMLGVDGKDAITYKKPEVGKTYKIQSPATTDEFSAKRLGLQWQWNHNPDNAKWSLTERPGYMRLKLRCNRPQECAQHTDTTRPGPQLRRSGRDGTCRTERRKRGGLRCISVPIRLRSRAAGKRQSQTGDVQRR